MRHCGLQSTQQSVVVVSWQVNVTRLGTLQVYKGSSKDTTWNKDLLWKLYVEHEAKQTGIKLPDGADDGALNSHWCWVQRDADHT